MPEEKRKGRSSGSDLLGGDRKEGEGPRRQDTWGVAAWLRETRRALWYVGLGGGFGHKMFRALDTRKGNCET